MTFNAKTLLDWIQGRVDDFEGVDITLAHIHAKMILSHISRIKDERDDAIRRYEEELIYQGKQED